MKDDKKKDDKKKSLIDPSKLNAHPKQVIKDTSKTSTNSNTSKTSTKNTTSKTGSKKKGPIPATPAHWIKCGVKLNPESIETINYLKVVEKLPNRDIIVETALQEYFKKFKSIKNRK